MIGKIQNNSTMSFRSLKIDQSEETKKALYKFRPEHVDKLAETFERLNEESGQRSIVLTGKITNSSDFCAASNSSHGVVLYVRDADAEKKADSPVDYDVLSRAGIELSGPYYDEEAVSEELDYLFYSAKAQLDFMTKHSKIDKLISIYK